MQDYLDWWQTWLKVIFFWFGSIIIEMTNSDRFNSPWIHEFIQVLFPFFSHSCNWLFAIFVRAIARKFFLYYVSLLMFFSLVYNYCTTTRAVVQGKKVTGAKFAGEDLYLRYQEFINYSIYLFRLEQHKIFYIIVFFQIFAKFGY